MLTGTTLHLSIYLSDHGPSGPSQSGHPPLDQQAKGHQVIQVRPAVQDPILIVYGQQSPKELTVTRHQMERQDPRTPRSPNQVRRTLSVSFWKQDPTVHNKGLGQIFQIVGS